MEPHIIKTSIYHHISGIINSLNNVQSVLDIGGIGRMQRYLTSKVVDANIIKGIDGSNLPYEDNQFSVTMSTATFEHIERKQEFIDEAFRVASIGTVHWFPAGEPAIYAESLRGKLGLSLHKSTCPTLEQIAAYCNGKNYTLIPFRTISEEFLLLATLFPKTVKSQELSALCSSEIGSQPYGYVLTILKG